LSNKTFTLSDQLHEYLLSVSPDEPAILRQLRRETAHDPKHSMQIAPEQGIFFQFLVKVFGVRRALEIGVYTGYSALSVALAMPDDGRLIACDVSKAWTDIGRRYWKEAGVSGKIDLRLGPALDTLDALIRDGRDGEFDFVFIDADKSNYWNYLERSLVLLKVGGVIAVDNVLWSGKVADSTTDDQDARAIDAFNRRLKLDSRIIFSMIPLADGITLVTKR
jgi:predicted O-methyltransferase YrrM